MMFGVAMLAQGYDIKPEFGFIRMVMVVACSLSAIRALLSRDRREFPVLYCLIYCLMRLSFLRVSLPPPTYTDIPTYSSLFALPVPFYRLFPFFAVPIIFIMLLLILFSLFALLVVLHSHFPLRTISVFASFLIGTCLALRRQSVPMVLMLMELALIFPFLALSTLFHALTPEIKTPLTVGCLFVVTHIGNRAGVRKDNTIAAQLRQLFYVCDPYIIAQKS